VDGRTRALVLGSLPGEVSLAQGQYYAHPQNQFWRLIGAVVGEELTGLGYPERLERLLEAGVGLWDVIATAERAGSLEAAIRGRRPNQLAELAQGLPRLRAIGFNGGTSARIGRRALEGLGGWSLLPLPSSSPAFTRPFEEKKGAWMQLRPFLGQAKA